MSGFYIHSGNRLEDLADVLADLVCDMGSAGGLAPEIVVVPSRGLERWLKLRLARVNGVSANLEFPFPQAFLEKQVFAGLREQIEAQLGGDLFAKDLLVWKLFFFLGKEVAAASGPADLGAVAGYLKRTGDELSRYQLALELSDLFDRYLLFRPELIRAWERGENPLSQFAVSAWQMALWRDLGRGVAKNHFAALQEIVNQMVYPEFYPSGPGFSLSEIKAKLPARLFLFGFAALPCNYLDLFKALSRLIEVHLFHVNPCAEFWGDQFRSGGGRRSLQTQDQGHPLLASWGRLGRAFFDLTAGIEADSYREYFVAPAADTVLAALQRQILYLQPPPAPLICSASDSSLRINLCHGCQREIEILYDTILHALEKDPELKPDDIFVMAPDISIYTPYIEALFARSRLRPGAVALDYAIVSSASTLNLPEIKALFDLMSLLQSRFFLREVFDLFSQEVVRRRFSVSESGLDLLANWLRKAAINWGIDGDFRKDVSLVDFAENSLAWGLDRLLAGYGLAGSELYDTGSGAGAVWLNEAGAGFQPLAGIEGSESLILGSFMHFVSKLRQAHKRLSVPLPAARWRSELERLLADFICPAEDDSGSLRLHQAFVQLDKYLQSAAESIYSENRDSDSDALFGDTLSCETILSALERELKSGSGEHGFFSGGITFSSILPLRAVPARMICLIGLNDGDFPRSQRPLAYDLIVASPRAGDRNARDEDRYLFLETLLAARKTLVLSYLGRDPKDNHLRPASVVVNELIDYVEEYFRPAPESGCRTMRDFLICDHPPQPFSPRYFQTVEPTESAQSARLFSFDTLQAEIATRISGGRKTAPPFFEKPLPDVDVDHIELVDLISFFNNPAKFFLRERLKVVPGIKDLDRFADSEPFHLDGLATYKFNDELVTHFLSAARGDTAAIQRDIKELEKRFAASGTLPPLAPGRTFFADKVKLARALAEQLKPYCASRLSALHKDVTFVLSGRKVVIAITLANLFQGQDDFLRQVLFRPVADLKKRDLVKTAMMNLGLEILAPLENGLQVSDALFPSPLETRFHTLKDKGRQVLPVRGAASARAELEELLELYRAGLKQPLAFLPELSLLWYEIWLQESAKKGDRAARITAFAKVRDQLMNDHNYAAQDEDFSFIFADRFEDEDFRREFAGLARQLGPVFMPPAGN